MFFCTSSRGLGSGMDSRSESDGHEENEDNTLSLLHAAGDGSNGSAGRPGLEGANSDAEDTPSIGGLPLDTSSRLEAQGLGEFLLALACTVNCAFFNNYWVRPICNGQVVAFGMAEV